MWQIFYDNKRYKFINNWIITEFEFAENLPTQSSTMQPRRQCSK